MTTGPYSKPLIFCQREFKGWYVPTVSFTSTVRDPVALQVTGEIINEFTEKATKKAEWKRSIASEVKAMRGDAPWDPRDNYAISLALKFCPDNHGHQRLDVENYVTPIVDAIAAGLFCDRSADPFTIEYWNFDDSNFDTLLIHRLPDSDDPAAEGIAMYVSATKLTRH